MIHNLFFAESMNGDGLCHLPVGTPWLLGNHSGLPVCSMVSRMGMVYYRGKFNMTCACVWHLCSKARCLAVRLVSPM